MSSGRSALPLLVLSALLGGCGSRSALCVGEDCPEDVIILPPSEGAEGDGPSGAPIPDGVPLPPGMGSPAPSRPEQLPPDTPLENPSPDPVPPEERMCGQSGAVLGSVAVFDPEGLAALEGCISVEGDLQLGGVITDLAPLAALERVQGTLTIGFAGTLQGLERLETVGALVLELFDLPTLEPLQGVRFGSNGAGSLSVVSGRGLTDLRGLEELQVSTLEIEGNPALASLNGLLVRRRAEQLVIRNNPALSDIESLSRLELGEVLIIEGTAISNVSGLRNVRELDTLAFLHDSALTDISALTALTTLGVLHIEDVALTSVNLDTSRLAPTTVTIQNNPNLIDANGLGAVTGLSKLSVLENPNLESLPEFPNVTQVGEVHVRNNARLLRGPGFPFASLASIVSISQNPSLTHATGFSLVREARTIDITRNDALIEVNLAALTKARRIDITCNPALPEASLEALRSVDAQVQIGGNQGSPSPCGP